MLDRTLWQLIRAALAPATRKLYVLALKEFVQYTSSVSNVTSLSEPASVLQVLRFVTLLHLRGLAVPSIRSKLSAIAYWHQLNGWANPTAHFSVRKCLLGISNVASPSLRVRGPVTPTLLVSIMHGLDAVLSSPYDRLLFRAVFLMAFFAFLRLGEYTHSRHNLRKDDVRLMRSAIKLRFSSFKFSRGQVAEILLPSFHTQLCPVEAFRSYMCLRPSAAVYCFVDDLGLPLKASRVRAVLRGISEVLGLAHGFIAPHSFRIGAATAAAAVGIPDNQIMRMGRWSSPAFQKYIRCQINAF